MPYISFEKIGCHIWYFKVVRVVHSYRDSNEYNSLLTKLLIMIWKLYDNKGLWGLANEKVVGKKGPNGIMTQQENAHPNQVWSQLCWHVPRTLLL